MAGMKPAPTRTQTRGEAAKPAARSAEWASPPSRTRTRRLTGAGHSRGSLIHQGLPRSRGAGSLRFGCSGPGRGFARRCTVRADLRERRPWQVRMCRPEVGIVKRDQLAKQALNPSDLPPEPTTLGFITEEGIQSLIEADGIQCPHLRRLFCAQQGEFCVPRVNRCRGRMGVRFDFAHGRNSTPWRRGIGRSRRAFNKGVLDAQRPDGLAVLHVLAVERVAAGLEGGGDDQRIVERQTVCACASVRAATWRSSVSGSGGPVNTSASSIASAISRQSWPSLRLATAVNSLSTCTLSLPPPHRARPVGLGAGLLRRHENIGVEEGAHRSLASSRSKR